jgi:glutathione S-transferase
MSNELKLYHSAASPNSRRVRIFLAEKGIAIPLAPVDLAKGEQHFPQETPWSSRGREA